VHLQSAEQKGLQGRLPVFTLVCIVYKLMI
jgi:hypothetical protein